ncbi:MAG: hypothetical protein Q9207_000460 [Kuettlingeria erythrocarpa]
MIRKMHLDPEERLVQPIKVRKPVRSRQPKKTLHQTESDDTDGYRTHIKRPKVTLKQALSTLNLLLRSSSFVRLPLALRFFCEEVHDAWGKCTERACGGLRGGLAVSLETEMLAEPTAVSKQPLNPQAGEKRKLVPPSVGGIEEIDVSYTRIKAHIEKSIVLLEEEGTKSCANCSVHLDPQSSIIVTCPTEGCQAMAHIACLAAKNSPSRPFTEVILPMEIRCTACHQVHAWVDLVREWSIRMRGKKDLAQILRVPRVRKPKRAKSPMPSGDPSAVSEGRGPTGGSQMLESLATAADILPTDTDDESLPDDWHELAEDSDEQSMTGADTGLSSHYGSPTRIKKQQQQLPAVIEDSEWDSAEVLD